jgi:hypothetical protein
MQRQEYKSTSKDMTLVGSMIYIRADPRVVVIPPDTIEKAIDRDMQFYELILIIQLHRLPFGIKLGIQC